MTYETGAVAGGEASTIIEAPADTGSDISVSEAGRALNAARNRKPPAESAESATAEPELSGEDNAAPVEGQAHGEAEGADPAEKPPIDRPKSWTEAEDAEWQATPRNLQQKIVARELERDQALRRSQNDAAEKLKGLTVKEQEAEQEKRNYQGKLPALMQALQDVSDREFPDIKSVADYERLANEAHRLTAEDPFRALQIGSYLKAFDAHQHKLVAVNAELQRADGEKRRATETELNSYKNDQDAKFLEFAPELAEPKKKAEVVEKAITALVDDLGFKRSELDEFASNPVAAKLLFHSAFQKLVYNHLKFSDLKAAPAKAVPKDLPPVVRPGTARPQGAAASERTQALEKSLTSSGDIKDATAVLMARRSGQRRVS